MQIFIEIGESSKFQNIFPPQIFRSQRKTANMFINIAFMSYANDREYLVVGVVDELECM